ncbi:MAG: ATP-binding protein [Thermomicrobiales bacterium]
MAQHLNALVSIARTICMRGIIEKWGRGTNRMVEQTLEAGLTEPEMIDSRLAFTVRFNASRELMADRGAQEVSDIHEEILAVLRDVGSAPLRDIVAQLQPDRNRDQVRNGLRALQDRGAIVRTGATNSSRWKLRELG